MHKLGPSSVNNILIIGGGDYAIASKLAAKSINSIKIVEIDIEVINLSKKYFPKHLN